MARFMPSTIAGVAINRSAKTSTDSNQLTSIGESIAVTAAQLTLGAAFGSIKIPKNGEIAFVQLMSSDIDSATSVTLSIGDAGDTTRLLAANTVGQAGGIVAPTIDKKGFGYRYTAETLVQIYVAVAPGTAVAGTLTYAIHYVSQ